MKVYLRAKGCYCLLAESGGNVAGFILTELAPDEGHIITLDVLETYRRQGIGSLLLAAGLSNIALGPLERISRSLDSVTAGDAEAITEQEAAALARRGLARVSDDLVPQLS